VGSGNGQQEPDVMQLLTLGFQSEIQLKKFDEKEFTSGFLNLNWGTANLWLNMQWRDRAMRHIKQGY
jgi:hypothetical protein